MPRINTFTYCQHRNKRPRGKASYSFQPGDGAGHIYHEVMPLVLPAMLYSQASRLAKQKFSGYAEVYLLP